MFPPGLDQTLPAMNNAFFSDLLASISERGRTLLRRGATSNGKQDSSGLIEQCEALLSGRGEASGTAMAREVLDHYRHLAEAGRLEFFETLARHFGPDRERLAQAIESWRTQPNDSDAGELHFASEPRRQELTRQLNRAPGGTSELVAMRADLLGAMNGHKDLAALDRDVVHLLSSWFNRGFLVLRRIDWSTPANILEKIIRYEAVHEIASWDDLRRRIDPSDRRCYAFFHPALVDEPLIFVEVALPREIPDAVGPIPPNGRETTTAARSKVAVFYSISNCQRGLAGVSFGNFLIKQVVEEVQREMPRLSTFVTLSPAPEFAAWLNRERTSESSPALSEEDREALAALDQPDWWQHGETAEAISEPLLRAAAWYYLRARNARGVPRDSVARFHLGNGARLERLNFLGDTSARGLQQSYGLMVNYLYDLDDIEKNHEAYAHHQTVIASNAISRLARGPAREVALVQD